MRRCVSKQEVRGDGQAESFNGKMRDEFVNQEHPHSTRPTR